MTSQILKDAETRPDLFHWFGAIDRDELSTWCDANHLQIPGDLKSLWLATGGGDILESETILGPLAANAEDQVVTVTNRARTQGLPEDALVFHVGLGGFTGYHATGTYAVYDAAHNVVAEFSALDQWYLRHLRAEFGARYELGPLLKDTTIVEG